MVTERNAQQTREKILQAAFDEMYENGYQGMRVDAILAKTSLAKGALYHHFPNKKALGYAVVDELIAGYFRTEWCDSLQSCENVLVDLQNLLRHCTHENAKDVYLGCPLNNLSQEMCSIDDGFHQRLQSVYGLWTDAITEAFKRGQQLGQVRHDIKPDTCAAFVVSSYQGIVGAAKCMQSLELLQELQETLCDYIASLAVK